MKVKSILAGVCGLAALFCSCTKNNPEQKPDKEPVAVEEVKLDATAVRVPRGGEYQLTATVLPEDATYDAVAWASDDESVATVDEKGLVTAVSLGTAKIKASVGEKYAECEVTVYGAATGITLDKTTLELALGGTSVKLVATVEPWNVSESEKTVTWTSANTEIAVVDENGTVSPVAEGETTVTAKCAEFKAECVVTVIKPAKVWAIGDYYEVDGVQGVVCWVSDDSQHGKIVSLDETTLLWSSGHFTTGATSEEDGQLNTSKVKDAFNFANHDSFKWCVDHGEGWYFPAISEVYHFLKAKATIDPILKEHGGVIIRTVDWYWSSTEGESGEGTEALCGYIDGGKVSSYGDDKSNPEYDNYVRAMYEF